MTANLTDAHAASITSAMHSLAERLRQFPLQLFVQTMATFDVIANVIDIATLYLVQRWPNELAEFAWVIDAKQGADPVTPWEDWWFEFVLPALQAMSATRPMLQMEGADYSHFDRFETEFQAWAFPKLTPPTDGKAIDLRKLMTENFRFSDVAEPGLELVDILTTTLRRALVGHLQPEAWGLLPHVMMHRKDHYVRFIEIGDQRQRGRLPYNSVVMAFTKGGRPMVTPEKAKRAK